MDIIRTEMTCRFGLDCLDIYGLRITAVNEEDISLEDPMITFLRAVLTAWPCSAHMSLDPWIDDPYASFVALFASDRFLLTPVGIYTHMTLLVDPQQQYRGVYFPRFLPDDLSVGANDGNMLIERLLLLDQPMLYLLSDEQHESVLREKFLHPPSVSDDFEEVWLQHVIDIVPIVLTGGHDESCFHAFARSTDSFALLQPPLQRTEEMIRNSAWFQANEEFLHWSDDDWEWCLTFECGSREHRRKCK